MSAALGRSNKTDAYGSQHDAIDGSEGGRSALLQIWQVIHRRRILIAAIIGACLLAGYFITLNTAPIYTARTEIEISREQINVTNVEGIQSQEDGRASEFYATQYTLLESESLAARVVKKLNLTESDAFFEAHGVDPAAAAAMPAEGPNSRTRLAVGLLLRGISILPVRTSRLVDIKYTCRSPEMAAQIANSWTEQFIAASMDRQYESTAEARKFLEGRLEQLKKRLEQSERDVVQYASEKGIVTLETIPNSDGRTSRDRTLATSDLETLNQALLAARSDRITAASRVQQNSGASNAEVIENDAISTILARRAEAEAEYANMLVRFAPAYPAARALKQQIAAYDVAVANEVARISNSRAQKYKEASARENDLQLRVNGLKSQLDNQRQNSIQYNIFQREADTNRQLYDALLQRYKEIGISGEVGTSNIAVVDVAVPPTQPSSPRLSLNMIAALVAGIALASAAVFGLEQIDEGVRDPTDIRKFLKVPLLGIVPNENGSPLEQVIVSQSPISEAYFSIRSTLALSTNHGLPRTMVITSTQQGEGKSTSSVALATIIGRTDKRVLLIDCDLRSPSIHDYMKLPNETGLSNLLVGAPVSVAGLVHETAKKNVFVLTSGGLPPSPAELLSSNRLREILDQYLEHFDHIIVDAPPALQLTDASLIANAVEGAVFVVDFRRTPKHVARAALKRLTDTGATVLGAILTKASDDVTRYSSNHDYRYPAANGQGGLMARLSRMVFGD